MTEVLVPLDGSPFADQALPLAAATARGLGARLTLVSVVPPSRHADAARAEARAHLDDVARSVGGVVRVVLEDGAVEAVLERVTADADLIVMSTHGHGPLSRAWFGSVADHLLRRSGPPVLLVRPSDPVGDARARPDVRRVVVALDGSELAERALGPADTLAAALSAEVALLRIVPIGPFEDEAELRARQDDARAYLARVAASRGLNGRLPSCTHRAVTSAAVAQAILDHGSRPDDLVALTTRGLGGVARLLFGSVADKVVRGGTVPTLVVRDAASS